MIAAKYVIKSKKSKVPPTIPKYCNASHIMQKEKEDANDIILFFQINSREKNKAYAHSPSAK